MQKYTEYEHQRTTEKERESINRDQNKRGMDNETSPGLDSI